MAKGSVLHACSSGVSRLPFSLEASDSKGVLFQLISAARSVASLGIETIKVKDVL